MNYLKPHVDISSIKTFKDYAWHFVLLAVLLVICLVMLIACQKWCTQNNKYDFTGNWKFTPTAVEVNVECKR